VRRLPDSVPVLAVFSLVYALLAWGAVRNQSATWDEPPHLTVGYAALTRGDQLPDHPPLLRMWAALPLALDPAVRLNASDPAYRDGRIQTVSHRFLFRDNDVNRLLPRARGMIIVLGVLTGWVIFLWSRQLFGPIPAGLTLALYTLEPNLMAHNGLVTTEAGLVLFSTGTAWFLWRLAGRLTALNLAGLAGCLAMASSAKFSALALWPAVLLVLGVRAFDRDPWKTSRPDRPPLADRRRKAAAAALIILVATILTVVMIWAVYGFRYQAPGFTVPETARITDSGAVERVALWARDRHLLPRTFLEGIALNRNQNVARSAYLMGRFGTEGWWYYFPVAFLVKTPVGLILLTALGVWLLALRRVRWRRGWIPLVTAAIFLAAVIPSAVNIGLRHVLPVYPFVLLAAGAGLAWLWGDRRRRPALALALLLMAGDFALVWPDCISAFNFASGGPARGERWLLDSNIDWGQDLIRLKAWMDRTGVDRVNLSYSGTADPAAYGIRCRQLTGAPIFAMKEQGPPILPGWVAVSLNNLYGLYYSDQVKALYRPLRERPPDARVGRSIKLWWVERPWWGPATPPAR
jgi:hypothetical protein